MSRTQGCKPALLGKGLDPALNTFLTLSTSTSSCRTEPSWVVSSRSSAEQRSAAASCVSSWATWRDGGWMRYVNRCTRAGAATGVPS